MDFANFEKRFFLDLKKKKEKNCIKLLNKNKNYINSKGDGVISLIIKKIYQPTQIRHPNFYIPYYEMIKTCIDTGYDFNVVIDNKANTPLMYFIMTEDFCSVYYIVKNCNGLNLFLKNRDGDDIFSLCLKLRNNYLTNLFNKRKSQNFNYSDIYNNSFLIFFILANNEKVVKDILNKNITLINQINYQRESLLIIATKLGRHEIVKTLVGLGANVNHKDYFGNTALYYAIYLRDSFLVATLTLHKADFYIRNDEGISPWDLAIQIQDTQIFEAIRNPLTVRSHNNNSLLVFQNIIKDQENGKQNQEYVDIDQKPSQKMNRVFLSERSHSTGELDFPRNVAYQDLLNNSNINSHHPHRVSEYRMSVELNRVNPMNSYRPLPNYDILGRIERDIYNINRKGVDHIKVAGDPYEEYSRMLFLHLLEVLISNVMLFPI